MSSSPETKSNELAVVAGLTLAAFVGYICLPRGKPTTIEDIAVALNAAGGNSQNRIVVVSQDVLAMVRSTLETESYVEGESSSKERCKIKIYHHYGENGGISYKDFCIFNDANGDGKLNFNDEIVSTDVLIAERMSDLAKIRQQIDTVIDDPQSQFNQHVLADRLRSVHDGKDY